MDSPLRRNSAVVGGLIQFRTSGGVQVSSSGMISLGNATRVSHCVSIPVSQQKKAANCLQPRGECRNVITTTERNALLIVVVRSQQAHYCWQVRQFLGLFLIFTILGLRPVLRVEHLNIALGDM
jgi:hypothetical protein